VKLPSQAEACRRVAIQALCELLESGKSSLECRQDDEYNSRIDETHAKMVWAHGGVSNWYRHKLGRVNMASAWRMVDYWAWLSKFKPDDYIWT
jgi:4-hydroxyacetophenone monooxygenase